MTTVLVAPRSLTFGHPALSSPADVDIAVPTRSLRFGEPAPLVSGTTAAIPAPTLLVKRRSGVTFIDTAGASVDCNLNDVTWQANSPTTSSLDVPIGRTDLLSSLLSAELLPDLSALIEVTVASNLLRFEITGHRLREDGAAVTFQLSDRRYSLTRRYVGRTGNTTELNPIFYATGTPTGWTAAGSPSLAPYAGEGAFGSGDGNALLLTGSGSGDYYTYTYTPAAVAYDRVIAFAMNELLPTGAWSPNSEGILAGMVMTDLDTAAVETSNNPSSVNLPSQTWLTPTEKLSIPANSRKSIVFTIYAQNGSVLVEDFNVYMQESLEWTDADVAQVLRDLVAHASDAAYGHADTGVVATTTSIPNTGQAITRIISSAEKQQVSSAVQEIGNLGGLWQRLTEQSDGTSLLSLDAAGSLSTAVATDANSNVESWEWARGNHADVLGLFAPDTTDFTGQRLIVWVGPDGVLQDRGYPWELGDELYDTGPYGSYDTRVLAGLVVPFANAKQAALSTKVRFAYSPAVVDECTGGSLRPGCLMDARVGTWPRGVTGRFRVVSTTLHTDSWQVTVELNKVAS